jgi:hypothetical protein
MGNDEDQWSMSDERAHIETVLGQRFNFLIVFASLVIGGAINSRSWETRFFMLSFGGVVMMGLSLSLFRAQAKLDEIFEVLKRRPLHPLTVIDQAVNGRRCPLISWSKKWLIRHAKS